MVGLLVVTHAQLSRELLQATEMILGPVNQAEAVSVSREDSVEKVLSVLEQACERVGVDGDGVIVLTDMFGGTPTNLSLNLTEKFQVEIVAGVNLPMVIKFCNLRQTKQLNSLAKELGHYAAEKIVVVSEMLADPARRRR